MRHRTHILFASLVLLALVCCSPAGGAPVDSGLHRVGTIATPDFERRQPKLERWIPKGEHLRTIAYCAGGGVVALLADRPLATYQFMIGDGFLLTGGRVDTTFVAPDEPDMRYPSELVGVAREGVGMFLERRTNTVVGHNVGARSYLIGQLDARDTVQSACAIGEGPRRAIIPPRAIAYVTRSRRDRVTIHDVATSSVVRTLVIPAGYTDTLGSDWADIRFGGSLDGGCVLWGPRMRGLLLVSDSAVRTVDALVEPVRPELWYERLQRWLSRAGPPEFVADATTYPGGVAVLFAGKSAGSRRIVDFYSDSGAYLETLVLPRQALRIAAGDVRLYVLSEHRDSVITSAFLLPRAIRARMPALSSASYGTDSRLPSEWLKKVRATAAPAPSRSAWSSAGSHRAQFPRQP